MKLAMNPDNVGALPDGRFTVAGGAGEPLVSTRGCGAFAATGCAFPARAVIVDFRDHKVSPVATAGGKGVPGFSVATIKDGRVYLGSGTGRQISVVPLAKTPTALP